ncbi:membrane-spanning 4-domains subfamily A member 15-like [Heptranchias perlo]|uniref:membrane-spanning 4-domains subfamily A member 15-like n=1 Tax=Heptranchias perlo TaxID=212740 RepID=UPI00355A4995
MSLRTPGENYSTMSGRPAGGRQAPDAALVPIVGTARHSEIPDPLQTFRNRELKALGVALVMLGIIQCGMGIPPFLAIPLDFSQSGIPFIIAILFLVSGSLAIVSEKDPQKGLVSTEVKQ